MQNAKGTLVLLGLLLLTTVPAVAQTENIHTRNNTDKWAWMTAIGYVSHWYGGSYDNIAATPTRIEQCPQQQGRRDSPNHEWMCQKSLALLPDDRVQSGVTEVAIAGRVLS